MDSEKEGQEIIQQLLDQYQNFSNDELRQKFAGNIIKPERNSSFSESRNIAIENLRNQFLYYLRRYNSAYGLLMLKKSTILNGNSVNQTDITQLSEQVEELNNTLKEIVSSIKSINQEDTEQVNTLSFKLREKNQEIDNYNEKLKLQNQILKQRQQDLISESQMMIYGSQRSRNRTNVIIIYLILCIIAIIVLVSLFTKLSMKSSN